MAWNEVADLRTDTTKTWRDTENPALHVRHHPLKTVLHYPTAGPNSEIFDGEVDFALQHITAGGRDLYRTSVAGWHYAVGKDIQGAFANIDGAVGFGGRQGAHWLKFRLLRTGYLHWPTRGWQDVGGAPAYNRANLSREVDTLTVGPQGAQTTLNVGGIVTWSNIWNTPGGGAVDISWSINGRHLKEEITLNQAAREWIAANRPPTTPATETWFGFLLQLDVSDIPRWVRAGIDQNVNGDFNDDGQIIELQDAQERLLGFMPVSTAYSEIYELAPGTFVRDTVQLRKRLWRDGSNYYLLVGARADQLNAMHQGAITFDPTLENQAADKDTQIAENEATTNFGSDTHVEVGNWATSNTRNVIIMFDVSSIPGGSTVSTATLTLTRYSGAGTFNCAAYRLLVDWVEVEATWNNRNTSNTWNTGGAQGSGTDRLATATQTASLGAANAVWNGLAADVQAWIGGSSNYGWVLDPTDAPASEYHNYRSAEYGTAGDRPLLVVDYTTGAGAALPILTDQAIHSLVFGGVTVR